MPHEIVVFGASGYTGRLVAEYLAQSYPDLDFAMAGRNRSKLEAVQAEMGIPESVALMEADSSDAASLEAMAKSARCVITTVGPYQLYGTGLVEACAAAGTDYCDLSGEPAWMADTIRDFDEVAKGTGARIVHSCGFDSVPFDLGVLFLQHQMKEAFDQPASRVRTRVRAMKGTFSGGTAASFGATMARAAKEPEVIGLLKDPFALTPEFKGPEQPHGAKPVYEEDLKSWSAPFIMASINTKNVHRTNALLNQPYGADFVYDEMVLTGDGEQGEAAARHVAGSNAFGDNPPKPGEGPSKEERETGFYDIMIVGETRDGDRMTVGVKGKRDPGYGSTSRMIAECALTLTRDLSQPEGAGVTTPGAAMGEHLIERLEAADVMHFKVEDQSTA